MNNIKAFILVLSMLTIISLYSGSANAVGATIENVFLDNVMIRDTGVNGITGLERGEEFTIKVEVRATEPVSDAQVEAEIKGIHNEAVSDITDTFDMRTNVTYIKKLTLKLPERADEDRYRLRVRVEDRSGSTEQKDYMIDIDPARNLISIRDVLFEPEGEVVAGRTLITKLRLKNMGDRDEEGIRIRASIPDLGIAASDSIDELEKDESTSSEELYMRIPQCAKPGVYDIVVSATYDDGDKTSKVTEEITVRADPACENAQGSQDGTSQPPASQKISISVPNLREVKKGTTGTVYPITISNPMQTSQSFTLSVAGVDTWGTYTFDPSNVVVVPSRGTASAYLYVTARNDAIEGRHTFALGVTSNQGTQTIPLEADVKAGESKSSTSDLQRKLEIGLIVLVILLVILGLVIAFKKMSDADKTVVSTTEEKETYEEKPTYY